MVLSRGHLVFDEVFSQVITEIIDMTGVDRVEHATHGRGVIHFVPPK
jgi:hypothetical protein